MAVKSVIVSEDSDEELLSAICPYDLNPFSIGQHAVQCPMCNRWHHASCWKANEEKCGIHGCPGNGPTPEIPPPSVAVPVTSACLDNDINEPDIIITELLDSHSGSTTNHLTDSDPQWDTIELLPTLTNTHDWYSLPPQPTDEIVLREWELAVDGFVETVNADKLVRGIAHGRHAYLIILALMGIIVVGVGLALLAIVLIVLF